MMTQITAAVPYGIATNRTGKSVKHGAIPTIAASIEALPSKADAETSSS
jgi:hypothetical protein